MEDFVASNQLHIMNEERTLKTFQGCRGESNIDLTFANNKMLTSRIGIYQRKKVPQITILLNLISLSTKTKD